MYYYVNGKKKKFTPPTPNNRIKQNVKEDFTMPSAVPSRITSFFTKERVACIAVSLFAVCVVLVICSSKSKKPSCRSETTFKFF